MTIAHPRRQALRLLATLPAWASVLAVPTVQAQAWPARPVRMVVPFPPGGGFDVIARPFAEKLAVALKQTVVVDNKAGAGGNIGTGDVARAANDGYTILFANEILATNPNVYKSVPFDPLKDFDAVAMLASTPLALAVFPALPARNLAELVALSAKRPLTFGTPGIGTSPHLFGELLNLKTPLKLRHIPYRGSGPAITDAMGGQTDAVLTTASSLQPHIASGKLRGIALMSDKRSALLPDVPTLAEGGIKGYTHNVWYALMTPAGTPGAVLVSLREAVNQVLHDAELGERLRKLGVEPVFGDDKAVAALLRSDMQRWAAVVADVNFPKE